MVSTGAFQREFPDDILDAVFDILRRDEYIKHHTRKWTRRGGRRDLCACALVSRVWRELTRRHVFYDLDFKFRYVPLEYAARQEKGEDEPERLQITCHEEDDFCVKKDLYDLDRFLASSPDIASCVRVLTLRSDPYIFEGDCSCCGVDRTLFLRLLERMSQLKYLNLDYVLLNLTEITPPPEPPLHRPSLASLTLKMDADDGSSEVDEWRVTSILQCFAKIETFHLSGVYNESDDFPRPASVTTHHGADVESAHLQASYLPRGTIFRLLQSSAHSLTSLVIKSPDSALAASVLQDLINSHGPRLLHLDVGCAPASYNGEKLPALDLSPCIALQSLTVGLWDQWRGASWELLLPMLLSLSRRPPTTSPSLARIAFELDTFCAPYVAGFSSENPYLSRVENALLELHSKARSLVVVVDGEPDAAFGGLTAESRSMIEGLLSRIHQDGFLHVVT